MKYISTNGQSPAVDFKTAVLEGLPDDQGLYLPEQLPLLPEALIERLPSLSFAEIAFEIASLFLKDEIPLDALKTMIDDAFDFPIELTELKGDLSCLELFHGPTLAFKDFAARFMGQIMAYLVKDEQQPLKILVATSGDTGGAVADAFSHIDNVEVVILYPKGRVSEIQELQLTTQGARVHALEVDGNFDDCQALVKEAFADDELRAAYLLSSANSINIARLIPQMFYYAYVYAKLAHKGGDIVVSIPSGNFGNITAAAMLQKMGLPITRLVAACNINDTVVRFLELGDYDPYPAIASLSNAMDVSDPSNFKRLMALYGDDTDTLQASISVFSFADDDVKRVMREVYQQYQYVMDPHTAVAYLGLLQLGQVYPDQQNVFVSTAHPAKFREHVQAILEIEVPLPESLSRLSAKKVEKQSMENSYAALRQQILAK